MEACKQDGVSKENWAGTRDGRRKEIPEGVPSCHLPQVTLKFSSLYFHLALPVLLHPVNYLNAWNRLLSICSRHSTLCNVIAQKRFAQVQVHLNISFHGLEKHALVMIVIWSFLLTCSKLKLRGVVLCGGKDCDGCICIILSNFQPVVGYFKNILVLLLVNLQYACWL